MLKYPELEGYKTLQIPIAVIYFDKDFNCRGVFTPQSCTELAESMRTKGLKIPIMVQPSCDAVGVPKEFEYRIVAGHRRFTAAKTILRWPSIPSIVVSGLSESDARILNLLENLERKDLSLIQEARAIRRSFPPGTTYEEMSAALNKSPTWCRLVWRLLDLPDKVVEAVASGVLNFSDVQALLYKDEKEQLAEIEEIRTAKLHGMNSHRLRARKHRRARSRTAIYEMLTDLKYEGRYPHPYKVLLWAAGELTNDELLRSDIDDEA